MDLLIVPDTVCAPCLPAPGSLYPLLWPLTCISRPSGASVGPRSSLSLLHPLHSQYLLAVSTHSMTVSLTPITWATGWVLPPTHPPGPRPQAMWRHTRHPHWHEQWPARMQLTTWSTFWLSDGDISHSMSRGPWSSGSSVNLQGRYAVSPLALSILCSGVVILKPLVTSAERNTDMGQSFYDCPGAWPCGHSWEHSDMGFGLKVTEFRGCAAFVTSPLILRHPYNKFFSSKQLYFLTQ